MVSLFSDRLSHRPGRGQSGVRLSVLRGSDQIWSRLHLVFWPPPPLCFAIEPQSRPHVHVPVCLDSSRGKGDYHRLGHGSDDHVRRPRQVQGLQGKKVIAIATGSLHCVCCTEDGRSLSHSQPPSLQVVAADVPRHAAVAVAFGTGEVYTWGDNDEGQLGDGTTNAIQRPRLVAALQGKKINRVACGSAHTLAWSTSKPTNAGKLPAQVPPPFSSALRHAAFSRWQ